MRVMWWTASFWPLIGGLEVIGVELLSRLKKKGYELEVIAHDEGGVLSETDSFEGIPIRRFPFHEVLEEANVDRIMSIRMELNRLLDAFRPELIHMHTLVAQTLFYPMVARSRDTRLLVTRHELFDSWRDTGPDTVPNRILRSADWVACCSEAVLAQTRQVIPELEGRSSVILNGSPMPPLEPSALSFTPPVILCLGRLVVSKGFDLAIEAFARILARHPDARLCIVGDGPARRELEDLVAVLGIEDAVFFAGSVPPGGVPREINASTVVLMPSRNSEGFGLVALEASQMGRPVIASRLGGLPEVVRDGSTGILIEPDDVGALSDAILRLLDEPGTAVRLGHAGREHAEAFSMERYADEYDALYRKLIMEKPRDV